MDSLATRPARESALLHLASEMGPTRIPTCARGSFIWIPITILEKRVLSWHPLFYNRRGVKEEINFKISQTFPPKNQTPSGSSSTRDTFFIFFRLSVQELRIPKIGVKLLILCCFASLSDYLILKNIYLSCIILIFLLLFEKRFMLNYSHSAHNYK